MAKKNVRELKVCAQSGYRYKDVPSIRLMGQWLEAAGFHVGDPVPGKYPFGVYGKPVLLVLTFLVPLALVQHWPLQYLLDRGPAWYGLLPLVSLLFLIPCALLWRLGVRHYCSTGS